MVLVPGMFGSRLADGAGRLLWGNVARLYFGPPIATAAGVRPAGLLEELPLFPGLSVDVHGRLIRTLERAGGYRRGKDLFLFDHDWRTGVEEAAGRLRELVARLRGAGDGRVDLVGVSTGGLVIRHFLLQAHAWARRVVYVGVPHRGTFDALASLHRGFRFAPGGKLFSPDEGAGCQTTWDALPHPDEPVFCDEEGGPLPLDLYDAALWEELGLTRQARRIVEPSLASALRAHRALDAAPSPPGDSYVIGATHLPTPHRAVVGKGGAWIPPPKAPAGDRRARFGYASGDGELPEASLRALPGLAPERVWLARPARHGKLPSDPDVHARILEALRGEPRA